MTLRSRKISLTTWIFLSLILGVLAGIFFPNEVSGFKFIGTMWLNLINLIKLIIVPLALIILMQAIVGNGHTGGVGKVVAACLPYYLFTTLVAVFLGGGLAYIVKPGLGFDLDLGSAGAPIETPEVTLDGFFTGLVSNNLFASFADGNMIQVLVISVLLGLSVKMIPNVETRTKIAAGLSIISEWVFAYLRIAIALSPIGVFFLMASTIGHNGGALLGAVAVLLGVFYAGVMMQVFVVYGISVWLATGMNPLAFVSKASNLWMFSIATTSSVASIPVNIKVAHEKFGVKKRICDFVIPLGSQINSDGHALLFPAVIVFAGLATGIDVNLGYLIKAALISILVSFIGGGVPGSGIVKILIALQFLGLPLEVGMIVAGFYRFFDMGTTTTNVLGDLTGAIMTNRLVGSSIEELETPAQNAS
ncbi:MAG: dicarboxylate/amino acid:cation symporter [Halomonas sp.]|nr:dicarboxylate/amino acid:cation symporter [Halomonas sp.]MBP5980786.1 dicarboxylate/amino acid:cation symporter [Halomonas sp.]